MLLIDTEQVKDKRDAVPDSSPQYATSSASALQHPPPTFEESAADHVLQFSQDDTFAPVGGEQPPAFTPYDANFFISNSGDIISHDLHLNDDGTLPCYP